MGDKDSDALFVWKLHLQHIYLIWVIFLNNDWCVGDRDSEALLVRKQFAAVYFSNLGWS